MRKTSLLLLFLLMVLSQLAAPVYMAWRWENILQTGKQFRWQTAPVDPYDAFRGRYIDLNFANTSGPVAATEHFAPGQTAYASIGVKDGFAYLSAVKAQPPDGPYIKVRINYIDKHIAHVSLPFKRYYLPEHFAPAAEAAYRENAKTGIAVVRHKDGMAVIEQLYIGDQTLEEYLRKNSQRQ